MPLFALVSGYLFWWSVNSRTPREVIIRQTITLVLPSFSLAVLLGIIGALRHIYIGDFIGVSTTLWNMFNNFIYGLWFLQAMFLASMIVLLVREKFSDSVKFYVFVLVIFLFMPSQIIPSTHIFVYPYFVAGYLWHRERMDEKINLSFSLKAGIILLWCIMLMFYDRASYVYTTGTALIKYRQSIFMPAQILTDAFRWLIGFVGCGAMLILLKLVKPVSVITALGRRSLGIYMISGYMMRYLPEHGGYLVNFIELSCQLHRSCNDSKCMLRTVRNNKSCKNPEHVTLRRKIEEKFYPPSCFKGGRNFSHIKANLYHVAILHNVLFPLKPQYSFITALRNRCIIRYEVLIRHYLRTNKTPR